MTGGPAGEPADGAVAVARVGDVWEGDLVGVEAGGLPILLVNLNGGIRAYVDRCAHLRVRLSEGRLEQGVLTCRAHRWQYDIATGQGVNPREAALEPLVVEVRGDAIYVHLERGDG